MCFCHCTSPPGGSEMDIFFYFFIFFMKLGLVSVSRIDTSEVFFFFPSFLPVKMEACLVKPEVKKKAQPVRTFTSDTNTEHISPTPNMVSLIKQTIQLQCCVSYECNTVVSHSVISLNLLSLNHLQSLQRYWKRHTCIFMHSLVLCSRCWHNQQLD